ncbi:hypothetical protein G6F43_008792 [Rhizopus delemar]|nr:hypothetical protein G6F43_008792 [Rhizopus delemar]
MVSKNTTSISENANCDIASWKHYPTNQNQGTPHNGDNQQKGDSSKSSTAPSPAAMWQTFRAYSRNTRNQTVIAFEEKDAKAASRERRNEKLWIQSSEKNSAVFDIQSLNLSIEVFLQSLSSQYSEAIGGVDTYQGSVRGTVVAFDSEEARGKACSVGIQISSHTIHGTPTLSAESSVYRVALDKLPILRPSELSPLLQEAFKKYGKVLHVGLYLDHKTKLFFGKGYVMLDITNDQGQVYQSLTLKPHFSNVELSLQHGEAWKNIVFIVINLDISRALANVCKSRKQKAAMLVEALYILFVIVPRRVHRHLQGRSVHSHCAYKDLAETNINSDSEDSGDSDYVPSNESEKDSDESQDESATDNMSIDSQEVNDLKNEAGKIAAPTLENQEYKSDA